MVYSDPCTLGCGVHHKFIDCPVFRDQRPWQRRDAITRAGRCYNCFCRHKISECTKPRQCSECDGRHHKMLNCLTHGRSSSATSSVQDAQTYSSTTQRQPARSPMNPASASFTPQTHGFLGHVLGQHDIQRHSPTTYTEMRDVNGVWQRVVAFFDSGSDTTLIKSSLATRLGLVGTSELFRYGVAGGGSKLERSTRYTLHVRPVHAHDNHEYTVEAMGIKQPAHDAPAIDETIFDDFPYLSPARGCLPLAGTAIDLLVGYDMPISSPLCTPSPRRQTLIDTLVQHMLGWDGRSMAG